MRPCSAEVDVDLRWSREQRRIPTRLRASRVDVVLLESVDGSQHLEQIKPVFRAGKPVFIDKPLAQNLVDVLHIQALGKKYDHEKRQSLLANPGIVRNRLKVEAAIQNAVAFLATVQEFGTFDQYLSNFVGHQPKQNAWKSLAEVPARTPESDTLSADLKRRGFKFVGSTICYAYRQAVGMVNDHLVDCFRYGELTQTGRRHG